MGFETSGGGTNETTLEDTGFSVGDFHPLVSANNRHQASTTTSNAGFNNRPASFETAVVAGDFPDTLHYRAKYRVDDNGATISVRLRNSTDNESVPNSEVESTGNGFATIETGVQAYTPTTTTSPVTLVAQSESDDNVTAVDLYWAQVEFGVLVG